MAKRVSAKQKSGTATPTPSQSQSVPSTTSQSTTNEQNSSNAIALLKADHRKVEALFQQYASASSAEDKSRIAHQVCTELIVHTRLEEELFYPACREQQVDDDMLDEAQVEHDGAKILVAELMTQPAEGDYYDAKLTVLSEYIKHHVGEEEKASDGIFAKAQAAGVDMSALGQRLQARKQELMQKAQTSGFGPPQPQSLAVELDVRQSRLKGDDTMARQYDRDRDEQGRFVSDDDDRNSSRSRGRNDDDRYSTRSRSRYDEDDDRYGNSRSRFNERDRDDQGRFVSDDDDRGNRSYSRGRDDDYRSSRGRGEGGWSGDSEASRRGWDERDSDRDRSYSQGRDNSRSGRGRDDDDYRSSSRDGGRGHGGWFGDPEGHARAAEQGWDDRRPSRSSRGRDDDDDDDRRGPQRGQSHGGWFGDSRGHAEASRRGWQNRR